MSDSATVAFGSDRLPGKFPKHNQWAVDILPAVSSFRAMKKTVLFIICYALWTSPGLAGSACLGLAQSVFHDEAHGPTHADGGHHDHGHDSGDAHEPGGNQEPSRADDCCAEMYAGGAQDFTIFTPVAARGSITAATAGAWDALPYLYAGRLSVFLRPDSARLPPPNVATRSPEITPPLYLLHATFLI